MNDHDDILDTEVTASDAAEEANVEEAALIEEETPPATGDDVETSDEGDAADTDGDDGEAEESGEEPEVFLTEQEVATIVGEVKVLPDATRERLLADTYHNRYEVINAIESEQSYLKMITDSGKPPAAGGDGSGTPLTEAQVGEKKNEVNARYLPQARR